MAERKFTPEQESAINTKNKTLLVSAAAGSGKTATLTERIIRSLTDGSEDIGRMLIVTFTNAAVRELRDRIKAAVEAALEKEPENKQLERQLTLLPMAKICTIDSFCNEILRKNSDKVGISPNYRVADAAEVEILSYSILSGLIDSLYENERCDIMEASEFALLADCLTSSKKNSELEEIFLNLYEKSKSTVEGVEIFKILADKYAAASPRDNEYTEYAVNLLKSALSHEAKIMASLSQELCLSGTAPEVLYSEAFRKESELLQTIICKNDYFAIKEALDSLSFDRLPATKSSDKTALMEEAVAQRNGMKDEIKAIRDKYFFYSEDELSELFSKLYKTLSLLSSFISEFDKLYMIEKTRRLMLEYSDIERFAYSALYEKDGSPSDFALSLRQEFTSVYIDEYQDVNAIQAKIFDAVSLPANRFMVGDIKQSIYGFRSAEPDIFASMKKAFPALAKSDRSFSASIFMSKNFRSDAGIIDFVNSVFDKAFGLTKDSIGYLSEDRLECGKIYEDGRIPEYKKPLFLLIPEKPSSDDEPGDDEPGDRRALECRAVAEKINELLKSGKLNSGKAPKPSDIAIIMRGNKQRMNDYAEALLELNIPSEKADDKSFFLNSEVLLALCLLNAIDNPEKDIYLAGLLASPLFSFTADELYLIRKNKVGSLFRSLVSYTEETPDFKNGRDFLEKLSFYRTLAEGLSVDALILRLYNDTGLLELANHNENGSENLLLLYNYAKNFSTSSLKGLYNFIKFINNVIERKTEFDAKRDSDEANAVHIMTVHASKGLEYPIVFYVDTDTALSYKERGDKLSFSEKFGLSMRLRSPGGLALVENPVHNLINHFNAKRYFEEELRIIYVALTRAREQLFIVGCVPEDTEGYFEKLKSKARFLDEYSIYKTKSPLELMLTTAEEYDLIIQNYDGLACEEKSTPETVAEEDDDSFSLSREELSLRLNFSYPDVHLTKIPEKLSISVLYPTVLDGSENEEISLQIQGGREKKASQTVPEFITKSKRDESAKRGIATHNYLQFFDIEKLQKNGALEELERLTKDGFISEENKNLVRLSEIELFEKSDFFKEMKRAKNIYRELRFNTRLPAKFFTGDEQLRARLGSDELLVQGVIDCILEDENGKLHLVDYKTDRLTNEELSDKALAEKKLNGSHALQLSYYSLAIEKIFGKAPISVRVYSLPLGDTVDINVLNFK